MSVEVLVVGAGFAGSVCVERFASAGHMVRVTDTRIHSGGNAHDRRDARAILVHPYDPNIFHTNSKLIFEYVSRFTKWRSAARCAAGRPGRQHCFRCFRQPGLITSALYYSAKRVDPWHAT